MAQLLTRSLPFSWDLVAEGVEFTDYARMYGRLPAGSTSYQDCNDFGDYTFLTDASPLAVFVSSSSASDTTDVLVTGLDANGDLQSVAQTLVGQTITEVGSSLTWTHIYRIENAGTAAFVGDVYCYILDTATAGVPDNLATKGQAKIEISFGRSFNGAYRVPSGKNGIIIDVRCGYSTSSGVRIRIMRMVGTIAPVAIFVGNGIAVNESGLATPLFIIEDDLVIPEVLASAGTSSITTEMLIALVDV